MIAVAGAPLLIAPAALAQTASQITPPSFRPQGPPVGGSVEFFGQPGLDTPPGADKLQIQVARVSVEGGLPALAAETDAIIARIANRRVFAAAIFQAARDLEAAYANAGYVLVRVVLPAQKLVDGGNLKLLVVNGYIETADLSKVPDRLRSRVDAIIQPLLGVPGLTRGEIERRLLIASDIPGLGLRSALKPGAQPGSTILLVEAQQRLASFYAGFDNTLASDLGRSTVGLGLDLNSPLGFGELFYFRGSGHIGGNEDGYGGLFTADPRVRTLAAGIVVPLGTNGLTFNVEGTGSKTTPKPAGGLQTGSEFERLAFRLRYPWIRSRDLNVYFEGSFDIQNEDNAILLDGPDLPLYSDRLRILRFSADLNWLNQWDGLLSARAIASFGINGLGARGADDASPILPLSTEGSDADFQKIEIILSYTQPIMQHLAGTFYFRGQTSFGQPLAQSEQIGFASFGEMSTFDAGTLGGDSGWMVRAELSSPWTFPVFGLPLVIEPYAYGATGRLYLAEPTAVEDGSTTVSAVAGGVRFAGISEPGATEATLALEYGRHFESGSGGGDGNRFTVVGSAKF